MQIGLFFAYKWVWINWECARYSSFLHPNSCCCHFHKYIPFIIFTVFRTFPTSSKHRGICTFLNNVAMEANRLTHLTLLASKWQDCQPTAALTPILTENWYFRREAKMGIFLTCSNSHIVGTTLTNSTVCSAGSPRSYSLWANSRSMRGVPQLNLCEMSSLDRSPLDPGCGLLSPPSGSESNYTKAVDVL